MSPTSMSDTFKTKTMITSENLCRVFTLRFFAFLLVSGTIGWIAIIGYVFYRLGLFINQFI